MSTNTSQLASAGRSLSEIVEAAIEQARPQTGLRWLDIGCGRGELLRELRDSWQPAELVGIDVIDWLDRDLAGDVSFHALSADQAGALQPADRVLMIEVIEHLESPWQALRQAARLVAPGGWIVLSTPNLATLRHRLELALRGRLTSFRPDNEAHLSPALPHVISRILREEGLEPDGPRFAGTDVISFTKGRLWPESIRARCPAATSVSVIHAAHRER
jgi:2-polyprenyl-3-methyl-5-hydroxy-6-metoxy-1,4-benzoquinol methylase